MLVDVSELLRCSLPDTDSPHTYTRTNARVCTCFKRKVVGNAVYNGTTLLKERKKERKEKKKKKAKRCACPREKQHALSTSWPQRQHTLGESCAHSGCSPLLSPQPRFHSLLPRWVGPQTARRAVNNKGWSKQRVASG